MPKIIQFTLTIIVVGLIFPLFDNEYYQWDGSGHQTTLSVLFMFWVTWLIYKLLEHKGEGSATFFSGIILIGSFFITMWYSGIKHQEAIAKANKTEECGIVDSYEIKSSSRRTDIFIKIRFQPNNVIRLFNAIELPAKFPVNSQVCAVYIRQGDSSFFKMDKLLHLASPPKNSYP